MATAKRRKKAKAKKKAAARKRKLTPKEQRFCVEYPVDCNATKAAKRAGYSQKTAYSQGQRLLKKAEIQAEIQKRMDKLAEKAEVTAERVIAELAKIGFADFRKLFNKRGSLIPVADLSDDIAAALSSIEVVSQSRGKNEDGETEIEHVHKIRLWDKRAALVDLGKHLNLFVNRHEHTGKDGQPLTVEIVRFADSPAE